MNEWTCPFSGKTAGPDKHIHLADFKRELPDVTVQRPAQCPGEIPARVIKCLHMGLDVGEEDPPGAAFLRTLAGFICRSGLEVFQRGMDKYTQRFLAGGRGDKDFETWTAHCDHEMATPLKYFIDFMEQHFFAALKGGTRGMRSDRVSFQKLLDMAKLPERSAEHVFKSTIANPAGTSHELLMSLIIDGNIRGAEFFEKAQKVSCPFLVRELGHINKFEAVVLAHVRREKNQMHYIRYDVEKWVHFFDMSLSALQAFLKKGIRIEPVHTGCGAFRLPGLHWSNNNLYEDFFLTIAKFYAQVTEQK